MKRVATDGGQVTLFWQARLKRMYSVLWVAELTGGQFFHAEDATQLEDVYLAIEALERRKREDVTYADHFDLYPRLLIPAFVLYLLSWLSACTWARRLP